MIPPLYVIHDMIMESGIAALPPTLAPVGPVDPDAEIVVQVDDPCSTRPFDVIVYWGSTCGWRYYATARRSSRADESGPFESLTDTATFRGLRAAVANLLRELG